MRHRAHSRSLCRHICEDGFSMVFFYRILLSTCMLLPVANHATCTLPVVLVGASIHR